MIPHPPTRPVRRTASRRFPLPILVLLVLALRAQAETSDNPRVIMKPVVMEPVVVGEAKTHTLFMGADISVNLDKSLYPVRNVIGSSWVIVINGKDEVVSAKRAPLNLKITPSLKLTEVAATLEGFRRVPAYSYANDPSVLLTRGLSQAASTNADLLAVSANAQHVADTATNKALGPMAGFAASDNQFGDAALRIQAGSSKGAPYVVPKGGYTGADVGAFIAQYTAAAAISQARVIAVAQQGAASAASQTANGDEPAGRLVTEGMDAMDIEFDVASPRTLNTPYVVTMTRFRTPGSKPGVVQNLVYAQALDPIYSHPTHVHFTEEGFPFNYELVDFQLHLYDRGQEIATNISSRRVELTRDEAFEYVKMEYISSHANETLPAVAAMGRLPAELPTRLAAGKYADTFFARVSKDGLADEPYADAQCSRAIEDPFLRSVVKSLRFKPALARGKPVEGIASLNLGKLQI